MHPASKPDAASPSTSPSTSTSTSTSTSSPSSSTSTSTNTTTTTTTTARDDTGFLVGTGMQPKQVRGRVCLITGGSSGVGAALAAVLLRLGMRVAVCARRVNKLADVVDSMRCSSDEERHESEARNDLTHAFEAVRERFLPLHCDLRSEPEIVLMFRTIREKWGGVDFLVNNAGVGYVESLINAKTEEWREMIEVNLLALLICTREAIKDMQSRGVDDGHVIHVSSISGHRLVPDPSAAGVYSATKFAVRMLAENLRMELRLQNPPSNIRVSIVSPGLIRTEFVEKRFRSREAAEQLFSQRPALTAEEVASAVVYALTAPPNVDVSDVILRATAQKF